MNEQQKALSAKMCARCGLTKRGDEFRTNNAGKPTGICKACRYEAKAAWLKNNPERARAIYARSRGSRREKQRRYNRESYARHRVEILEKKAAYWIENPEKAKAWWAVKVAVRDGVLVRPEECQKCGSGSQTIEASHTDYSRQLDVEWLCPLCHRQKDAAMRAAIDASGEGHAD